MAHLTRHYKRWTRPVRPPVPFLWYILWGYKQYKRCLRSGNINKCRLPDCVRLLVELETTIARLLQLLSKSTLTTMWCAFCIYLYLFTFVCVCVCACACVCVRVCACVCMKPLLFHRSSGPQKCSACIKEDIFEEPTSILKQGCVSIRFITQ